MSTESTGSNPGTTSGEGNQNVENMFSDISFEGGSQGSNEATTQTTQQTSATTPPAQPTPLQTAAPATPPSVTPPATPPVQQSLSLSPEQLAAIVGAVKPPVAEPVVKEPTPEETDAHFNVIRPKEEDIATVFRGGPEGTAKMQELLHGAAKMGATIASHHLMGELKKLHEWTQSKLGELAPTRQIAESQIMDQHAKTFFSKFPHWSEQHVPILKDVYDRLLAQKFQGTPEEVYSKINDEALRIARVVNPQFAAAGATGNGGNPAPVHPQAAGSRPTLPPSQMTTLPSGGSGGSGAATGSSNGAKTGPQALFD